MPQHYSPKTFLRQTSNELLRQCFAAHGALKELPWPEIAEHKIDAIYDAWQNLPELTRLQIESLFEDVDELADEDGLKVVIEEGQFHGLDLTKELEPLPNYRDKALYVWLNHRRVFEVSRDINRAHSLPQRFWHRRGHMPRKQPDVSSGALTNFRKAIAAYYKKNQGRGDPCTVDPYLRGNRYHYFFVYPDDYADTYLGHDETGQFIRRPQRPAFEVIFLFDPIEGTLDLYAKGGKKVNEALQTIFCRTLLGQDLPPANPNSQTYELNGLKSRNFRFPTDAADGIEEVRLRKLRLSPLGGPKDRIILHADPAGPPDGVYRMMDGCLNRETLPEALINVTLAEFHFRWAHTGQGRPKTLVRTDNASFGPEGVSSATASPR
jgi:hypothetical protein